MALQIYNTLTREKEPFTPRDPGRVGIYVCGITPYSESHIGHARPSIVWDVIKRYLAFGGYQVFHVQNFTDVDDKIIAKAQQEGVPPLELSDRYARAYLESMDALGVGRANLYPKVSTHIDVILEMIERLVQKGYAYPIDGDVYFDVTSFEPYGRLSGRSLDQMQAGARVQVDERKRHPGDFALWKAAKPGELSWNSPWGVGRPGWHIECSAMSLYYLGAGFDLHGGGPELAFPHHENEIAQSQAYLDGEPFVQKWVHHGLINLRDEKMSKSLGNIVTIDEVLERYPAGVIRFFFLSTHYRKPVEFSFELLDEAEKGWNRLAQGIEKLGEGYGDLPVDPQLLREIRAPFVEAMDDDLNTALALGRLFDLLKEMNSLASQSSVDQARLAAGTRHLLEAGEILGLLAPKQPGSDLTEQLMDFIIELRQEARAKKDWGMADRVRDQLKALGIALEDTPTGARWRHE